MRARGWLQGTFLLRMSVVAIIVAFGHSLLAMSGFETLAQVYREIETPKLKNLKITGTIVCVFAVFSTGVITLLAGMIIPDAQRRPVRDNLLGGLAMHLAGPQLLRLAFHVFVVVVGVLILSGAVNTSMIGANGVLNRVAEDGVLTPWFRKPHRKFGTTLSADQPDHRSAARHHPLEPRRRHSARRSLCVRRRLEFLPEGARRAGASLQATRSGIQDAAEHQDRRA